MAQLNIYVPDKLEKKIRKQAKFQRKSLSAYLADLIKQQVSKNEWQKDFFKNVIGGWQGDFPEMKNDLPEERENL